MSDSNLALIDAVENYLLEDFSCIPVSKSKTELMIEIIEASGGDMDKLLEEAARRGVRIDFSARKAKSISTSVEGLDIYTLFHQKCIQSGKTIRQGLREAMKDWLWKIDPKSVEGR